ncbi:MAG: hypothetical protein UT63_C0073G0013 [Candidatus Gottesmanbacteria bacterium GW2011_GWC2_39_8]|uniref:Steroid 5-alpha reductase C-terminal domain-containing protein n=1 Tax=Candidatus Gottesmanbacteria bacterium GW2011_GWC2_39_8 TaxID=1618450 RepID=A0A0G0T0I0_9BACT|nr:MAG: hypothetical protein UT63_C0073G0013 [Candidatus Gottesmanbacteria bacterium GW2011_GWC2_39_8]
MGNSFGVLPEKKKRVKRGLYKYFDHPIYVGIYLTFLGLSIALGSLPGFLYDLVIMIPLSYYRAKKEEKLLHD